MRQIDLQSIENYKTYLIEEEKSGATIEKYIRDVTAFYFWCGTRDVCKQLCLEYKADIVERYAERSVNSIISSLNSYFDYMGWHDCKVKTLKIQRQIFADKSKELTKAEYGRISFQNHQ